MLDGAVEQSPNAVEIDGRPRQNGPQAPQIIKEIAPRRAPPAAHEDGPMFDDRLADHSAAFGSQSSSTLMTSA